WVQGIPDIIQQPKSDLADQQYKVSLGDVSYDLSVDHKGQKVTLTAPDSSTLQGSISEELDRIKLLVKDENGRYLQMLGKIQPNGDIQGHYLDVTGKPVPFAASRQEKQTEPKKEKTDTVLVQSELTYPFSAYGRTSIPDQKTIVIQNATVWTNTDLGIRSNTDVLIRDGQIAKVGEVSIPANAEIIDGTDMHLTPGIIDEHSHIAISKGINEASLSSSAAVRMGDVLNSEDINIYRQLAGGVTTSQVLHGSATSIGGQSVLIKLRWGVPPEDLKLKGADPCMKFALGENVKQSNWLPDNTPRLPQTRMGVAQVYEDYFTRAREYGERKEKGIPYRNDLEMETLLEIGHGQRFIPCHRYGQSEINM